MDETPAVVDFALALGRVCVETVESGKMTKDRAVLIGPNEPFLRTEPFMGEIKPGLKRRVA